MQNAEWKYCLILIVVAIAIVGISKIIFDTVTHSDLPLFWKWFLLR